MANETIASVNDFEIFKEAMIGENLEVQIEITKRLVSLAKILGEKVTREELLPFIHENIDFHDEILLNLSEQLHYFIPLVGGYEHCKTVLDLLAKLCNTDETMVREKSVETLKQIGKDLTQQQAEELFIPILENLVNEDWFTSKCSATELYSTCYPKVNEEKKAYLRNSFRLLTQDETPMVRRSAALNCVELIECMELIFIKNEFISVFDNIARDAMDAVKAIAIDLGVAIAKKLTQNEIEEFLFKTIERLSDDSSWRLRQRLAEHIAKLQKCIWHPKMRGAILSIFQNLVKDPEPEVRIVAARNLRDYCESLKETYTNQAQAESNFEAVFEISIMPQINYILNDEVEDVRLALSVNILSLSNILSIYCFKKNILPLLTEILEHEQSSKLQANMLQSLSYLPASIDVTQFLKSIKNVIKSIIVNSQTHWRTRRSILVAFIHIAKLSSSNYFATNLKIFYAALLSDSIFAIRRTAPIILPLLTAEYGINWTIENLIPYFTMFMKDYRYLYRYVPLFGISELIRPTLSKKKEYLKSLQKLIQNGNKDLQAKAAIKLAKLEKLFKRVEKKTEEQRQVDILQLHEEINKLKSDDVRLYAGETFDALANNSNDIFNITETVVQNNSCLYLEGILKLLYNNFFKIIQILFNDPVENVQIRAMYTLHTIKQFLDELREEFSESWVQESLLLFSKEELDEIDKCLDEELNTNILLEVENKNIISEDIPELDHFGVKKDSPDSSLEIASEVGQPMQIEISGNRKIDNFIPENQKDLDQI